MSRVAVIGAGLIGRAWAMVFARAGAEVALHDSSPKALKGAVKQIAVSLADLKRAGLLKDPRAVLGRIQPQPDLAAAVRDAAFVQENLPERLEVKQEAFRLLDRLAPKSAILSSSTSTFQPSLFTADLNGRARCLVAHPVNPPYLVPVVELSGAPWTSPATIKRARAVMQWAGMAPIQVLKEIDGFILNRLQLALLNEAFRLIDGGYVTPADLDVTVKDGLGLRWAFMGPMETIDLNAADGTAGYLRRYGEAIRRLDRDIKSRPDWADALIERLHAERRRVSPIGRHAKAQSWRDRRLMALLAHKRDAARRIKPA
ncbi:MAG: 3-hydroxyacyl-CoA dehydrogenase [Alphaproteobacteria bacterium]|nr:3-hydroxyacyl-CoA dehydrogenase [Alphaproteobacteria bacterium]